MPSRSRVPMPVWGLLGLSLGYGALSQIDRGADWPRLAPGELAGQLDRAEPPLVLDVRTGQEFAGGHVPGARNVYFRELPRRLEELAAFRNDPVVVYCETGSRSRVAIRALREAGFRAVFQLDGDMRTWRQNGLPLERPAVSPQPLPGG